MNLYIYTKKTEVIIPETEPQLASRLSALLLEFVDISTAETVSFCLMSLSLPSFSEADWQGKGLLE